jgi:hypothetical protein
MKANIPPPIIIDTLDSLAYVYLCCGHFNEAELLYRFLHDQEPEESKWVLAMAYCRINTGRHNDRSVFEKYKDMKIPQAIKKAFTNLEFFKPITATS